MRTAAYTGASAVVDSCLTHRRWPDNADVRGPRMEYVVVEWQGNGVLSHDPTPYLAELPRLRGLLPPGAREFACDPAHYDFYSARCVKDLKFGHLRLVDD